MKSRKKIITLCVANFCRSPVANKILNNIYGEEIEFDSAGLHPMTASNMDKRSEIFLKSIGISDTIHLPKKITQKMIDECDSILCMDHFILGSLNKIFPNNSNKFKLITFQTPRIQIPDPFKFSLDQYNQVMNNIHRACKEIKLSPDLN